MAAPKKITTQVVLLAYFQAGQGSNGLEAIRALHEDSQQAGRGGISAKTLLSTMEGLNLSSEDEGVFECLIEELVGPLGTGQRGRSAPQVGDSRSYKAQQVKDGSTFLRLPLDTLGGEKGESFNVSFEEGRIVVTLYGNKQ